MSFIADFFGMKVSASSSSSSRPREENEKPEDLVKLKDLRKLNPILADFYEHEVLSPLSPFSYLPPPPSSSSSSSSSPISASLDISNTATPHGENSYIWELKVVPSPASLPLVRSVTFHLHPTFSPSVIEVDKPPFHLRRSGWGVFKVDIIVKDVYGNAYDFSHQLSFANADGSSHTEHFQILPPPPPSSPPSSPPSCPSPPRMQDVEENCMHGALGVGKGWKAPLLLTYCDELARPGYNSMKAHEYSEDPHTLKEKVKVLAELIRSSSHFVVYSGAGISTSSGIGDYASKSGKSAITAFQKKPKGLDAEPTFAHFALTALHRQGFLKHWVQQNHDGLPQKAGFPQKCLNEIHGAWFDPSNPVVPMSGSLRGDLFSWMKKEENEADLVIAMGTSLCGMNADNMVKTPAKKFLRKGHGKGSVIIGFQQTRMDELASLRIFCNIDQVLLLLMCELHVPVPLCPYSLSVPPSAITPMPHRFRVPYDSDGNLSQEKSTVLDLSLGAKVRLTAGPGKGFVGEVVGEGGGSVSYTVRLPNTREGKDLGVGWGRYCLGSWWIEAAAKGEVPFLPLVNVHPSENVD